MLQRYNLLLIIAVFAILNLILLFTVFDLRKNNENNLMQIQSITQEKEKLSLLQTSILKSFENSECQVIKKLSCIDLNGEEFLFDNLIKDEETLVLFIPEYACDLCYNNQIKLLNDYFGNEPKSVLILTSLDYDIFCERFKSNHFKDRFYFIREVDEVLEQQLIYYFYLNKGEVSDIFYPAREFLGINHRYLKMMKIKIIDNMNKHNKAKHQKE